MPMDVNVFQSQSKFGKRQMRCYYCNRKGHLKKDCRKRIAGERVNTVAEEDLQEVDTILGKDHCWENKHGLIYLSVLIKNTKLSGLLDTGATCSVIDPMLVKTLDIKTKRSKTSIKMMNGSIAEVQGKTEEIVVKHQNKSVKISFVVANTGKKGLILGMDWAKQVKAVISTDEMNVYLKESACSIENWSGNDEVDALVKENEDLFVEDLKRLQPAKVAPANIEIKRRVPIRTKQYRLAKTEEEEVKKEINNMLNANIIRKSNSNLASPIVVVNKKDETKRICVDFRKINEVTETDPFPLPLIDEIVQKLAAAKVFSSSMEEHLTHLKIVFEKVRAAGLSMNRKKMPIC